MDSSDSGDFLYLASTSLSCNNSIQFVECNKNYFTLNRETNFPLGINAKDDERNIDEGKQKEILVNRESIFLFNPNLKDYESTTGEGRDEEFSVNRESNISLIPSPKDYESTNNEAGVKNFKSQSFHIVLTIRIMRAPLMKCD